MKVKIEIDTERNNGTKFDPEYIKTIIEKAIEEALKLDKIGE